MSEKDINRWQDTIVPRDTSKPWTIGSGGSWDMANVQPIPDEMLAELAHKYHHLGTPWNCRSLPLMPADREYMYLLYYSMQGLVARMRAAEAALDAALRDAERNAAIVKAAHKLVASKGRYHTERAFTELTNACRGIDSAPGPHNA